VNYKTELNDVTVKCLIYINLILAVMSQFMRTSLRSDFDLLPPGFIADAEWLKDRGIDERSIHDYIARGWIKQIAPGIYQRSLPNSFPEENLRWQMVLLSLQYLGNDKTHLGRESALNITGHIRCPKLMDHQRIHLYGCAPSWLKRLPLTPQIILHRSTLFKNEAIGIFDTPVLDDQKDWITDIWHWRIKTSCPERAILEAMDELPFNASFENLDDVFRSLTRLRPNLLMKLLTACRRVKVRRLFFVFADRHDHPWREHLETDQIDFGSGPRALVKGGRFHARYQITLPPFLMEPLR